MSVKKPKRINTLQLIYPSYASLQLIGAAKRLRWVYTFAFSSAISIVKALTEYPKKEARGNWILKDGKNGYRKLIEPTRPYQLWTGDWKELKIPSPL